MGMKHQKILSAIVANRTQFFALVETLERECACVVDEVQLTSLIDSDYDGREEVTIEEAHGIVMAVSCSPGVSKQA